MKEVVINDQLEVQKCINIFEEQFQKNRHRFYSSNFSEKNRYIHWTYKKVIKYSTDELIQKLFTSLLKELHNDINLCDVYEGAFLKGGSKNKGKFAKIEKLDFSKGLINLQYVSEIGFIERKVCVVKSMFNTSKSNVIIEEKITFNEPKLGFLGTLQKNELIKNRALNWQMSLLKFEAVIIPAIKMKLDKKVENLKKFLQNN